MSKDSFVLKGFNDSHLFIRTWLPEGQVVAGIHLLHGLGEHSDRYDDFARYLNRNGFVVWCHDHRQHGQSISHDAYGIFNEKDTWEAIVEDVAVVQHKFKETYPKLPMFMLGHSMGSLILRCYLQIHPTKLAGSIIMGTPVTSKLLAKAGTMLANLIEGFKKGRPSPFMDRMATGSFNKTIRNPRTPFDWISHDEVIVDKYAEDPLCGFVYSPLFYGAISSGSILANEPMMMKAYPKIPTLIISGDMDPCGLKGKGVKAVSDTYRTYGLENNLVLMEGMRHEVLNEKERRTTFEILKHWLNEQI